ncbi:proton-conducting transporter transmembrane domain-containing protein [Streptosporangium sp. V21-05]|uniref:proton-conducting transporter transmembrane domain-containing protein n=1 Tax=Streptosporangium sp. V21-05 TaxID=3446115 RepID=UPI003F53864F
MIQSIDYYAVAPPLILALTAGLVLLLDAFLPHRPYVRTALGAVTLAGVIGALAVVISQAVRTGDPLRTFCVPEGLLGSSRAVIGAIVPPVTEPTASTTAVAPCSFVVDDFTLVFAGLALAAGIVVVLLSAAELSSGDIPVGEWYFLLLCTLAGAVALPASRDLIMLVVALELVSLPVFALTALKRYDGRSSEAAVKLFLVSVVSTAVMLFGVSLLYGTTGTVYLDRIAHVLRQDGAAGRGLTPGGDGTAYSSSLQIGYDLPAVVTVAVVLVLAGFAFKIAVVPFHAWAGDVYQGAPIPVAALLSVISKAAGFAGLILILVVALGGQGATWVPLVAILAALTMTVGNLLAMRQRHAVRLLAWSSVAQSGYILAPLGIRSDEAMNASIAYLVFYAAMNLGAFAVVTLVSRRAGRGELDDYRGLAFRSPAAGLAMAFFLICLAGLPPGLAGLFAKIVVFRELLGGGEGGGGGWLAAVMAVNTVVGLYYYVAWVVRIFTPAAVTGGAVTGGAMVGSPVTGSVVTGTPATGSATTGGAVTGSAVTGSATTGRALPGSVTTGGVVTGSAETGGRGAGWIPASVAVAAAGIVAIAFSVAPQLVLDLVPAALIAAG